MKPSALIRFRITKFSLAPSRSLYIHVSTIIATVSLSPPSHNEATKVTGITASKILLAWVWDSLLAGIGRQALFTESSTIEPGRRWLAMSKRRTLSQFQVRTCGKRERMVDSWGSHVVVSSEPVKALKIPNTVSGMTMDLRSLHVKSHKVWMCDTIRSVVYFLTFCVTGS